MNSTFTYQWSEDLARAALSAYYSTRIGKPRSVIMGGSVILVAGVLACLLTQSSVGLIPAVIGVLLCIVGVKMMFDIRRLASDSRRLVADPTVTVVLDTMTISVSSKDSCRSLEWHQISHVREADGFLLLFTGKLIAGSFPVAAMSAEQKEFITKQVQASNTH